MDTTERFMRLYRGNSRSFGRWFPANGRVATIKEPVTHEDFRAHIEGRMGVGIVPVMDDGDCWFGALDLDAHGDLPDIDLVAIEAQVRSLDLPLVVCRSKSGGAHLYVFGSDPLPAPLLRQTLTKWASMLGWAGCEVFPKQDRLLTDSDGERQLGNWINLPWFDALSDDCLRYAVEGGRRVSFEYFLDLAESRRISAAQLVEKSSDGHEEAPPCIQSIISGGVGRGQRNEALYNLVIYLKKSHPETWKEKAFDLNARVFETPLSHAEAKKTITSAGRRDYRYRCREEPCRSRCKAAICVTRKFGITPDEKGELEMGTMPEFGPLEKYTTDPPRWVLRVDGSPVTLSTMELMDFRMIRVAVADRMTRMLPPMKNDAWQVELHRLMQEATLHDAPEDASATGQLRSRLRDFFHRADLSADGRDRAARDLLLLGSPVVQLDSGGVRRVYFRGNDFIDYLKKNRSEELKGPNLWMALRQIGVEHGRIRIGDRIIQAWHVALTDDDAVSLVVPSMEPEL